MRLVSYPYPEETEESSHTSCLFRFLLATVRFKRLLARLLADDLQLPQSAGQAWARCSYVVSNPEETEEEQPPNYLSVF